MTKSDAIKGVLNIAVAVLSEVGHDKAAQRIAMLIGVLKRLEQEPDGEPVDLEKYRLNESFPDYLSRVEGVTQTDVDNALKG